MSETLLHSIRVGCFSRIKTLKLVLKVGLNSVNLTSGFSYARSSVLTVARANHHMICILEIVSQYYTNNTTGGEIFKKIK
jgi:hypothetical protein